LNFRVAALEVLGAGFWVHLFSPCEYCVVRKRNGGFATQDAAKIAARADAKKIKDSRQPGGPTVGTIKVGRNVEKPTR
jgi:hypothetical protein